MAAPFARRPWMSIAVGAALAAAVPAWAVTAEYQCTGYRPLTVSSTPQQAHVQFEGQDWMLKRVREAREARYTSVPDQVTIAAHGRALDLELRGQHLECKLLSDALGQKVPASGPAAAAHP